MAMVQPIINNVYFYPFISLLLFLLLLSHIHTLLLLLIILIYICIIYIYKPCMKIVGILHTIKKA
jgi:4-hydroxybenzoate polyprenyltransferase